MPVTILRQIKGESEIFLHKMRTDIHPPIRLSGL